MRPIWILPLTILLVAGCDDEPTAIRDVTPPAAPRGVYTVTGDHQVTIHWLANTEVDVAGYRVFISPCADAEECPAGSTTGTSFIVTGLANGATRFFAVSAYDRAGNQGPLAYEDLVDTPRPAGTGLTLQDFFPSLPDPGPGSGYDFSAYQIVASDAKALDMYYGYTGGTHVMFVPDLQTDIQDAGYARSLDAVDFAPTSGWSPSGTVELIVDHCYIVWTRDDHYAKFRVTSVRPPSDLGRARVTFDWAYQVDAGNPQLRATKVKDGTVGAPRPVAWVPKE